MFREHSNITIWMRLLLSATELKDQEEISSDAGPVKYSRSI